MILCRAILVPAALAVYLLAGPVVFAQTYLEGSRDGRGPYTLTAPTPAANPYPTGTEGFSRLPPVSGIIEPDVVNAEPIPPGDAFPPAWGNPDAKPAAMEEAPRGLWRFVPTGMVPFFGPRTSERQRYSGYGPKLIDTSWLARPLNVGLFAGGIDGDPLVPGRVDQWTTFYGGLQYGWDYDHRWGIEKRLGYAPLRVSDLNVSSPPRSGNAVFGEYRLMYYPWGDTQWRPFVAGALGGADFHFTNDHGHHGGRTMFLTSFGAGIKYLASERLAWRMEIVDLLTYGQGELATMNNFSFVGGFEYRFNLPKRWRHGP